MNATTTTTRPVTEADVRVILDARLDASEGRPGTYPGPMRGDLPAFVSDTAQWLVSPAWYALEGADDAGNEWDPENARRGDSPPLWIDLRTSEARRLQELVSVAVGRAAQRCEAIILEELTAAGVQFAAEYPDAPRP